MLKTFENTSVTKKLVTGLATIAGLGFLVAIIVTVSITSINKSLNNITDITAPTVETASDLVSLIWEANKVAEEIIADEQIEDVRTLSAELTDLEGKFEVAYDELTTLVTDPNLLDEMKLVLDEHNQFKKHSKEMTEAHLIELEEEIISERQLEDFDRIGGQLVTMLDEFAVENEAEMQQAEDAGDEMIQSGRASAEAINEILGDLFETDYPAVEAALKMQRLIIEMQDTAGEYLASEKIDELPSISVTFTELAQQVRPHLDVLDRLAETAEDKEDARALTSLFETWFSTADDPEALFDNHGDMLRAEKEADELTEIMETDADSVAAALTIVAGTAEAISNRADEDAATIVNTAMIISVTLLLILAAAAFLVFRIITQQVTLPLVSITETMTALAGGDTIETIPFMENTNEIGDMARAIEVFRSTIDTKKLQDEAKRLEEENRLLEEERQREAEERAQQEAEREEQERLARRQEMLDLADEFESAVLVLVDNLGVSADEMEKASTDLSSIAQKTTDLSQTVTHSARTASENVDAVAAATEEMSSSIQTISSQTTDADTATTSAVQETASAVVEVSDLVDAAHEVGNIVSLINDIAAQTNLLALNATIEAARAGEAGKGFAVVASEVKSLAGQTADATKQIDDQIAGMQTTASKARGAMDVISGKIDNIGNAISEISMSMQEQHVATSEIASSVSNAAQGATDVNTNISVVSSDAVATGAAAKQVLSSAQNLSTQSAKIKEELTSFINKIRSE